jgi:hypothetical protein
MPYIKIATNYYQQFDADFSLDVPGEGYGGWKRSEIEISKEHTAVVVMHAWDCGTRDDYPGWHRAVEYIPRSYDICRNVFPGLLSAVRASGMELFHVVGGNNYCKDYPGYERALELAGPEPDAPEVILPDPSFQRLMDFRLEHVFYGKHNRDDILRGCEAVKFPPEAEPLEDEGIAENSHQLFALCKDAGVNHLLYVGFAINWCLMGSYGGMIDMSRRGFLCSTIRQAVTAVENKETARQELCKQIALWQVSVGYGFVFDVDDFIAAISR